MEFFGTTLAQEELTVTASACMRGRKLTPADYVRQHQREQKAGQLTVTYTRNGNDFSVMSGIKGARIFYHKLFTRDEWCTRFNFEYDQAEQAKYDVIAGRIAASFKP